MVLAYHVDRGMQYLPTRDISSEIRYRVVIEWMKFRSIGSDHTPSPTLNQLCGDRSQWYSSSSMSIDNHSYQRGGNSIQRVPNRVEVFTSSESEWMRWRSEMRFTSESEWIMKEWNEMKLSWSLNVNQSMNASTLSLSLFTYLLQMIRLSAPHNELFHRIQTREICHHHDRHNIQAKLDSWSDSMLDIDRWKESWGRW